MASKAPDFNCDLISHRSLIGPRTDKMPNEMAGRPEALLCLANDADDANKNWWIIKTMRRKCGETSRPEFKPFKPLQMPRLICSAGGSNGHLKQYAATALGPPLSRSRTILDQILLMLVRFTIILQKLSSLIFLKLSLMVITGCAHRLRSNENSARLAHGIA